MVYVFDDGVEPSFAVDAVATAEVAMDTYGYSIALMAANYNAAFTCTGTDFIPADGKSAEVLPGAATELNFLAEDAPPPVGSLYGEVATELAEAESCTADFVPTVYVFGKGVCSERTLYRTRTTRLSRWGRSPLTRRPEPMST
jgi:hypothetical protein